MSHQLLFSEAEVFTGHSNDSVKRPAFKPAILYSFGDCSVRVSDERIDVFPKSSREHGRLLRDDAELVAQSIQISRLQVGET